MRLTDDEVLAIVADEAPRFLRDGELGSVRVLTDGGETRVELVLVGETMRFWVGDAASTPSLDAVSARFASDLQDFIAESRFGWGQLRERRS